MTNFNKCLKRCLDFLKVLYESNILTSDLLFKLESVLAFTSEMKCTILAEAQHYQFYYNNNGNFHLKTFSSLIIKEKITLKTKFKYRAI